MSTFLLLVCTLPLLLSHPSPSIHLSLMKTKNFKVTYSAVSAQVVPAVSGARGSTYQQSSNKLYFVESTAGTLSTYTPIRNLQNVVYTGTKTLSSFNWLNLATGVVCRGGGRGGERGKGRESTAGTLSTYTPIRNLQNVVYTGTKTLSSFNWLNLATGVVCSVEERRRREQGRGRENDVHAHPQPPKCRVH
jgi:hypothetical protein